MAAFTYTNHHECIPGGTLRSRLSRATVFACALLLLAACDRNKEVTPDGLVRIVLQTDWYAQPEHGGFYQAVVQGYYEEEGLHVEILPGGPNAMGTEKVAQGRVQFALGRSDDVIIHTARGVPLLIAGALMQKDPLAIMFHQESGITDFKDLDGRVVMSAPGAAYIEIMERKFDINLRITPLDYGMARFIADKNFIQQCFITNEPYYVRRQGADPGMLLIADSGFNPYRVWYTSREFAERNPDVVEAFSRASIRGWQSYLYGDPDKANALIAGRNPQMDPDFMAYSREAMIRYRLVDGEPGTGDAIGKVKPERLQEQIDQLLGIEMIRRPVTVEEIFRPELLPDEFPRGPFSDNRLPLNRERQKETDLELVASWPGNRGMSSRFVTAETLASLPHVEYPMFFDGSGAQTSAGVPLATLLEMLGPPAGELTLLANCSDLYQSNFTHDVIAANKPVLVTQVGGVPTVRWASEAGKPGWGPYLIDVIHEHGLAEPGHKKPWGVVQLVLAHKDELLDGLLRPEDAPTPELAHAYQIGRDIFVHSCASCHQSGATPLGGTFSVFALSHLAIHARHNEGYFMDILRDPEGTNPAAARMPPTTAWPVEELGKLRLWIAAHAP